MDHARVLDTYGSLVEDDLKAQLAQVMKTGEEYHPFIGEICKRMEEFILRRGKRLASCSTLMVYKGYTNEINEKIVRASSAIELYRHCILVHDDIVDSDSQRRGGKTLHKVFRTNYDSRFGKGSAIFAGNILYALSLGMVLQSGFESGKLLEVVKLFSAGFRDVNESQILDLLFEYREPTVEEWRAMASKRASSLFKVSMLTGAILASTPEKDMDTLNNIATHIGYSFDIQDDIIDTFASRKQYGREPLGDVLKRKKPLHMIIAISKDKDVALAMRRDKGLGKKEAAMIKEIVASNGALDEAKSVSREHSREARRLISETQMNEEAKDFFASFISYIDESLDWYR